MLANIESERGRCLESFPSKTNIFVLSLFAGAFCCLLFSAQFLSSLINARVSNQMHQLQTEAIKLLHSSQRLNFFESCSTSSECLTWKKQFCFVGMNTWKLVLFAILNVTTLRSKSRQSTKNFHSLAWRKGLFDYLRFFSDRRKKSATIITNILCSKQRVQLCNI